MGKILATVFLVVFIWYSLPLLANGIWISPTLYPDYWGGEHLYDYDPQVASDGEGWFNFDIRKGGAGRGRSTASVIDSL